MLSKILKGVQKHSPLIFTILGATTMVTTVVLAVRATPDAQYNISVAENNKGDNLDVKELVKVTYKSYLPAVLVGVSSLACIFAAYGVSSRQQKAATAAYLLLAEQFRKYKEFTKDLATDGHIDISHAAALQKYEELSNCVPLPEDARLYYDEFSDQMFFTTPEILLRAFYNLNRKLVNLGECNYNDWWEEVGIEPSPLGASCGWCVTDETQIEELWIEHEARTVTMDDGLECVIVSVSSPANPRYDDPPWGDYRFA